jgi:hypothetical protein
MEHRNYNLKGEREAQFVEVPQFYGGETLTLPLLSSHDLQSEWETFLASLPRDDSVPSDIGTVDGRAATAIVREAIEFRRKNCCAILSTKLNSAGHGQESPHQGVREISVVTVGADHFDAWQQRLRDWTNAGRQRPALRAA